MAWLWLLVGVVVLTVGAEALVRGASRLALAMNISPLVVGLTVVACGTSAPEFVVSVQSSLAGNPDLALGNVVGSNIFNVLLILGLSALIAPLVVDLQLVRFDVPLMILLSLLVAGLGYDGVVSRGDGLLLVAGLAAYLGWCVRQARKVAEPVARENHDTVAATEADPETKVSVTGKVFWQQIALVLLGLVLLVVGARWFLGGAVDLARALGVSELVIGLTLVAGGTSLPELATSLLAALRGERDIAVGNVVGSNIFNILGVLGASATVSTSGVGVSEAARGFDIPVMAGVAVACLPIFLTGHRITRWEGALFLAYYVAYVTQLILAATNPVAATTFRQAMLWYVLPLTAVTLLIGLSRHIRSRHSRP
ncbi:MAG: calcium/sodium antiporter [Planctomycetaceae bacterium]